MTVGLKIKRIDTQESLIAEFESLEDAKTWVAQRPEMVEVLGVVDPKAVGEAAFRELRDATRPLDAEELAGREQARETLLAQMREADERESAPRGLAGRMGQTPPEPPPDPSSLPGAPASAVMVIRWQQGASMANIVDNRPIPSEVREAVEAWVSERNKWLHAKRTHVGRAELRVRPGELSANDAGERVEPGASYSQLPGWPPE
ncbi:MAG: hypothetical protein ACRBN8_22195 [Nannocystales bacterium]